MKKTSVDNLFTPAELEQIKQAVAAAELSTSGEIATMVVERSDPYPEALTLGSMLAAALTALLLAIASHHVTIWSYLPLVALLYFPAYSLFKHLPTLLRPFIGINRLNEAVRQRAILAFYEKGLYRTRDETGILIFISIFERKVWILGDRGINARIPPETWQELAQILATGLKSGQAADALCTVIGRCGAILSQQFPRRAGATNELADGLLRES